MGDSTSIGIYITFRVSSLCEEETKEDNNEENESRRSAFALLMRSSRDKLYLPDSVTQIGGYKDRLLNTIIDWMESNSLFFSKHSIATVGKGVEYSFNKYFLVY